MHYGHSHPETFSVLIKYTDLTYQIYKGNIMKNIKLLEVRTCKKMYVLLNMDVLTAANSL